MEEHVSAFQSIIDDDIKELIIVTVKDGKGLHAKCSGLAKRLLLNNPGRVEINVYSAGVRNKRTHPAHGRYSTCHHEDYSTCRRRYLLEEE